MKPFLFLCLSILISSICFAQINVETVTGEFPGSGGVKFDTDGSILIGNFGDALPNSNGTQIWRYDPVADTLIVFATGFQGASGNAFDSKGNFFQSNIAGGFISKIDSLGQVSTFSSSLINGPVGIAIDNSDNLFVCNCSDNTIVKVDSTGQSSYFSSSNLLACPNGITIGHDSALYVSNFNNGRVIRIDENGTGSNFANLPGSNNGHLSYDPSDSAYYVASHGSSTIYKLNQYGDIYVLAGTGVRGNIDGDITMATFSRPNGIAVSPSGDTLYVNSSVPLHNNGNPLNPSLLRRITGLNSVNLSQEDLTFTEDLSIHLYPNPCLNSINISGFELDDAAVELSIYDLSGALVMQRAFDSSTMQPIHFDLSKLLSGSYLMQIRLDESIVYRRFSKVY